MQSVYLNVLLRREVSVICPFTEMETDDKLQNYFGIALRSNLSTVENMANAIWASFFHVASSEENNFHSYCAKSAASWCQYQRDQVNKTNLYKPGKGLSTNVIKCVKPIYLDLIKSR